MTTIEISREKMPIRRMPQAERIAERFEQMRDDWPKRITFGIDDEPIDPERVRNFYRDASLATFQRILPHSCLVKVDQEEADLPYMIYQVEKDERAFVGSIMGVSCPRYYRIYMEAPEGVIVQHCGEYSRSLRTTQILDLGTERNVGTP